MGNDVAEAYTANYNSVNHEVPTEQQKYLMADYAEYLDQKEQKTTPQSNEMMPPQEVEDEMGPSKEDEELGIWHSIYENVSEIPKQVVGGAYDAVDEALEAVDDVWDWGAENFDFIQGIHEGTPDLPSLPDGVVGDPETVTGGIARSASQFLVGFIPALKGAKAIGLGTKIAPYVAGAMADATVFDPLESRVSNLVESVPALQNPITGYLAAEGDDTGATGRFKNALEGLALGGLTDGIFKAIKGFKKLKGSKVGDDAITNTQKSFDEQKAEQARMGDKIKPEDVNIHSPEDVKMSEIENKFRPKYKPMESEVEAFVTSIQKGEKVDLGESLGRNLELVDGGEDLQRIVQLTEKATKRTLDKARSKPGKGLWGESEATVKEMDKKYGLTLAMMKKTAGEVEDLPVKVLSAKMIMQSSDDVMVRLEKEFLEHETDEALIAIRNYYQIHGALHSQMAGISSNISRGLNMHKKIAKGMTSKEELELMAQASGGKKALREIIKRRQGMAEGGAREKFIKNSSKAKTKDAIFYYWINSILSGYQTQAVNIISNAVAVFADMGTTALAGAANLVRKGGEVTVKEAGYRMMGDMVGTMNAIRLSSDIFKLTKGKLFKGDVSGFKTGIRGSKKTGTMWKTAITDEPQLDTITKFEHSMPAISGEAFGWKGKKGHVADFLGSAIGVPGRALMTFDELFKSINFSGELYANLAREGISKHGLKGKALREFIKKESLDPKKHHFDKALGKARENTFQEGLGQFGRKVQGITGEYKALQFMMPFIRTPVNLLKYVGRRTPVINRLSSKMRDDIAAGGARAEMAKAQIAMGASFYAIGTMMAASGKIVGHDFGHDERQVSTWLKRQPVSIDLGGGHRYSFDRADPFGQFFCYAADFVKLAPHISEGELTAIGGAMITILSENLVNKTYLRGLSDVITVLSEDDPKYAGKKGQIWLERFTTSFIPNFLAQEAKTGFFNDGDMQRKEIDSLIDRAAARLPWASEGVAPRRDQLSGEPMMYGEGVVGGMVPFFHMQETDDPVRLKAAELNYNPQRLKGAFADGQVPLNAKQKDRFGELVGKVKHPKYEDMNLSEALKKLINLKGFNDLPLGPGNESGTQKHYFSKMRNAYVKQAKISLMEEYPELFELYKAAKGTKR